MLQRSKKLIITILFSAGIVFPSVAVAQDDEDINDSINEAMQEVQEALGEIEGLDIQINTQNQNEKWSPRLDLYLDDLDFEDVYKMHYPENYGVLITGVMKGGNADRAGLAKNDIIMEFDGEKVRFEDHLRSLRDSKNIGDTVEIKFFRNEKILTTKLTFNPPPPKVDEKGKSIKEKKLSVGYGGGGPEAFYIDYDFTAINRFLENNGFDKFTDGYTVTYGGYGMGYIGKGWFIGGMGSGFEKKQQIPVADTTGVNLGWRKYLFKTGFGGVTLVKKFPLFTERIIVDLGMMLGGGQSNIRISQTDGDYSWNDAITNGNSYALEYNKNYFVYRPSLGVLVRIKNWIGVHGSVGYLGTYSSENAWTESDFEFTVGGDSPKTLSGVSYSLGIWFGY